MSIKLVGNINVALVFGLSQFVTTFVVAGSTRPTHRSPSTRWPRS